MKKGRVFHRKAARIVRRGFGLALSLGLMLFAAPAFAQTYDVVGLVIDGEKGDPIANVEVSMLSGKVLGYSKSNGRFEVTVNSHNATLIFKKHTYKNYELDLTELTELIDIEVPLENEVLEIAGRDTVVHQTVARAGDGVKTMEELEALQGMKIDLNDHLRQLPGVSGMNEFTNDISVWGSRTHDVTHYLGQSRIPSLRHLDIGFPGNESVLNPRLLKSITLSDNLAKGPISQGNSSALVYDLKEGDPNNITGDVVFGTVNRELNLTGYWEGRTFLISGRYLEPTFLSNLGEKFFTESKDARLQNQGKPCDSTTSCRELKDPFSFSTFDGYVGTYYKDSTGAFSRHSFIGLNDEYTVNQDVSKSLEASDAQTIVQGTQDGMMYAYEGMTPGKTGDLSYSLGILHRNREETFRDTLASASDATGYPWYPRMGVDLVDNFLGTTSDQDFQITNSWQWNSNEKVLGASYGYGVDLEYMGQIRKYLDIGTASNVYRRLPMDYALANALYRLKWNLSDKQTLEASLGGAFVYQGFLEGQDAGVQTPAPLASLRYTRQLTKKLSGYGEVAVRANTAIEPTDFDKISAVTTSSGEGKVGVSGGLGDDFTYTGSLYSRFYKDPTLPIPEVYWNYRETHSSDWAYADGVNVTAAWLPSHHMGVNVNASIVDGYYHLEDGTYLPWEANRTMDLVSNLRILPRNDSLLSFILTYGINNGAPLYEYTNLFDPNAAGGGQSTGTRTIRQSTDFPTVSRQRTDVRINLDLKSHWRPLDGMRFFFEADNLFSDFDNNSVLTYFGGANRRRRGWTRADQNGDLLPVVTKGMGLFIMFGFEGKLLI